MDGGGPEGCYGARALMSAPTDVPFDLLPFSCCDQPHIFCNFFTLSGFVPPSNTVLPIHSPPHPLFFFFPNQISKVIFSLFYFLIINKKFFK